MLVYSRKNYSYIQCIDSSTYSGGWPVPQEYNVIGSTKSNQGHS